MNNIVIDQGLAALVAALIASFFAIIASIISIRSSKMAALLSARQGVVGQDLKDLSHYIYQIVALSVEAAKSHSPERFNVKLAEANKASNILSELRIRHRYSIPFIFEALWYLKGMPIYIEHYRNDLGNPRIKLLRNQATKLRKEIDLSLENYFFYGKAPGYFSRRRIKSQGRKLEKIFLDGKHQRSQVRSKND